MSERCSVIGCKNKVNYYLSNNVSKGSVPFCDECLKDYNEHMKTREDMIREQAISSERERIRLILKASKVCYCEDNYKCVICEAIDKEVKIECKHKFISKINGILYCDECNQELEEVKSK